MQNYKFFINQMPKGQIPIPSDILNSLIIKPGYKIKVILEIFHDEPLPEEQYNFNRVRKITRNIKNNISSEIIADRTDRI